MFCSFKLCADLLQIGVGIFLFACCKVKMGFCIQRTLVNIWLLQRTLCQYAFANLRSECGNVQKQILVSWMMQKCRKKHTVLVFSGKAARILREKS